MHAATLEVLNALLNLQNIRELLLTGMALLERPSEEVSKASLVLIVECRSIDRHLQLRRKIIKILQPRLEREPRRDQALLDTITQFIPRIATLLQGAADTHVKHAAIACLDTIIEKYGKSTANAMVAAAEVVAGSEGLGARDDRIQVAALFCLRSAVEILGAATVPVVAIALPKALGLLEMTLNSGSESTQVHSAVCAFLSAVIAAVPWMVTPQYLDTMLKLIHQSTMGSLAPSAQEDSMYVLRLIAGHVPPRDCFAAIQRTLAQAMAAGPLVRPNSEYFGND